MRELERIFNYSKHPQLDLKVRPQILGANMSQPPPMKLWETVSAFREFRIVLAEVFGSEQWNATYGDGFLRYDQLVRVQDRAILNSHLPVELKREIARRCDGLQFYISPETGVLRRATSESAADGGAIKLTALDVHDRFGGSVIEGVLENGSATVKTEAAQS